MFNIILIMNHVTPTTSKPFVFNEQYIVNALLVSANNVITAIYPKG